MNIVAVILLIATVVFGAFGVVFVIEGVKRPRGDRKRPTAYALGSFFAAIVLGLAGAYVARVAKHKRYTYADYVQSAPSAPSRAQDAMMTAMMSSQTTTGTFT